MHFTQPVIKFVSHISSKEPKAAYVCSVIPFPLSFSSQYPCEVSQTECGWAKVNQ